MMTFDTESELYDLFIMAMERLNALAVAGQDYLETSEDLDDEATKAFVQALRDAWDFMD